MLGECSAASLRVIDVIECTSVDGPGLRTSIYFAGCAHRCPGCHNMSTWAFDCGTQTTVEALMKTIRYNGFNVTFSGGDPMYQAQAIVPLAAAIKAAGLSIWCYTGFNFEQLMADDAPAGAKELLKYIDELVDVPFIEGQRDTTLHFRGSANQRLIKIPETLASGAIKLFAPVE